MYQLWYLARLPSFYFHGSGFSKSQMLRSTTDASFSLTFGFYSTVSKILQYDLLKVDAFRLKWQFGIMHSASSMDFLAKLAQVSFCSVFWCNALYLKMTSPDKLNCVKEDVGHTTVRLFYHIIVCKIYA